MNDEFVLSPYFVVLVLVLDRESLCDKGHLNLQEAPYLSLLKAGIPACTNISDSMYLLRTKTLELKCGCEWKLGCSKHDPLKIHFCRMSFLNIAQALLRWLNGFCGVSE